MKILVEISNPVDGFPSIRFKIIPITNPIGNSINTSIRKAKALLLKIELKLPISPTPTVESIGILLKGEMIKDYYLDSCNTLTN